MFKSPTHYREVFIPLLREIRVSKGLTQVQVAARLKAPQSYVSKYETGERRLDFVETALVCRALGMSIVDFARTYSARLRGFRRAEASNL